MISVDVAQPIGSLRELHGANIGPLCMNGYFDLSEYHRRVRFPTIRLHDCLFYCWEVVDIPSIFPLFHLDAADPGNYRFARTDGYIQSILNCGSRIVYRLGVTIQNHPDFHFHTDPPEDYNKWADICINIIRHYNEGWANGFHHDIQYWEVWNEAENGGPCMWNAPYEEYIRFYIQVAKRIKAACPTIKIGGPAFNGAMLTDQSLMHTFLQPVHQAGAPLDFCTWHAYPERPMQLVTAARNVRTILDSYGYTKTESHLNEWNLGPIRSMWGYEGRRAPGHAQWIARKKGAEGGAMAVACLIALQDAPIDMANYYDATNGPFGMFHDSSLPAKPYYAFLAFREMLDHTPIRCMVTGADPDQGLAVLAGSSLDGDEHQLFIGNVDFATVNPVLVTMKGMPNLSRWQVEYHRLDAHANLEMVESFTLDPATYHFDIHTIPQTAHLIRLRRIG
jgi:hypothetical protein